MKRNLYYRTFVNLVINTVGVLLKSSYHLSLTLLPRLYSNMVVAVFVMDSYLNKYWSVYFVAFLMVCGSMAV